MYLLQTLERWRFTASILVLLFLVSVFYFFHAGMLQKSQHSWFRIGGLKAKDGWGPEMLLGAPIPGLRNIFFVETSCAVIEVPDQASKVNKITEPGGLRLTARTACALEAAASTHPQRPVYLVHMCPVDFERMWATAPEYVLQVLAIPNVRLWPVRLANLLAGSPVEDSLTEERLRSSDWPEEHARNIAKLLLLKIFGGTFLDQNVLLVRSLGDKHNFAYINGNSVNNAVLDFARDKTGKEVSDACINEMRNYDWTNNSLQLVSRVLSERCGKKEFTEILTEEKCGGFRLLPSSEFYRVNWIKWEQYFTEQESEATMKTINSSIGDHVRNSKYSQKLNVVPLKFNRAYAKIAHRFCPQVVVALNEAI